jgi:hypothetical protein
LKNRHPQLTEGITCRRPWFLRCHPRIDSILSS